MADQDRLRDVVSHLREDYQQGELSEASAGHDPFALFRDWLQHAVDTRQREPNAMTVATATAEGAPSARIVLLRSFDEQGFVFYTNYDSRKGRELAVNARVALVFYWASLERQIRVTGTAAKVSHEESERYFQSRPPASQLGAWASDQSHVIPDRGVLESRLKELADRYEGQAVPLPDNWGGFRVSPIDFEFWQGRRSRLHDRLRYFREGDRWRRERLAP